MGTGFSTGDGRPQNKAVAEAPGAEMAARIAGSGPDSSGELHRRLAGRPRRGWVGLVPTYLTKMAKYRDLWPTTRHTLRTYGRRIDVRARVSWGGEFNDQVGGNGARLKRQSTPHSKKIIH
ncbi:hypothetical protein Zmor_016046 [Zophobas morio]|uniref:Uncharacterized protein n=1 Tax=Zophobas morio TaxID=2755281 RepID=A0AA38IJ31_9CUCU|nr:hypothetical protein Zmor_016046 [Zophobas morio]